MFWALILAHLIADFPFQTKAIIIAKKRLPGRLLHVGIHTATMLILLPGLLKVDTGRWGMIIVLVTVAHFAIDSWKNRADERWPERSVRWYLIDQLLHLLSILLASITLSNENTSPFIPLQPWIIPAIGYLWTTRVWFITECVINWKHQLYLEWVIAQEWPRMMSRVALYSALLMGWTLWTPLLMIGALTFHWIDLKGQYHSTGVLIDCTVVGAAFFLHLAA